VNSRAIEYVSISKKFFLDFKRELKEPSFMRKITDDILAEFERLFNLPGPKNSDIFYPPNPDDPAFKDDPRNILGFTMFHGMSAETDIQVFFHGFYECAVGQKDSNYSKWDALKTAKSSQAKMMVYIADNYEDFFAHFYDAAFYQSIDGKCEFGNSSREVRNKLWQRHQLKLKSGKKPSKSPLSKKILSSYTLLLKKLSPAFKSSPHLSSKIIIKKDLLVESVVEWVSSRNPREKFDTYVLAGKCIRFRKPERIAIYLLKHMYGVSISTVERSISIRK
jgi:hypothetical protein